MSNIHNIVKQLVLNETKTDELKTVADVHKLVENLLKTGEKVCSQEFKKILAEKTQVSNRGYIYFEFGEYIVKLNDFTTKHLSKFTVAGSLKPDAKILNVDGVKDMIVDGIKYIDNDILKKALLALTK